jgi:F-type H+-transporting ATPase subunit delta
MMLSVVGNRYAHALGEIVFASGSSVNSSDIVNQLKAVEELLASSHELAAILVTPAVTNARKRAVMEKLLGELGVSDIVRNLLFVLVDHRRITHLSEVRAGFEALVDQHSGVAPAEVISAEPLNEAQTQALQMALNQLSGMQVRMNTSVDSALLGGVVARIGSTVYDGSVRGQLEGMRRKLSSESAN